MTDIDKQVKEIELCASAHCDDGNVATGLVLGKAADTIAAQSARIEELEKIMGAVNVYYDQLVLTEKDNRENYNKLIKKAPKRPVMVDKHTAQNWMHLEEVTSKADEVHPISADTIRWLLWNASLRDDWHKHMVEMIVEDFKALASNGGSDNG